VQQARTRLLRAMQHVPRALPTTRDAQVHQQVRAMLDMAARMVARLVLHVQQARTRPLRAMQHVPRALPTTRDAQVHQQVHAMLDMAVRMVA